MKKIIITVISLVLSLCAFCQERFLRLKAVDTLTFQTRDTLYATFYKDTVIIKDANGVKRKFILKKEWDGPYFSDMIISSGGYFHSRGDSEKYRDGKIFMDDMMKLYFDNNSNIYKSSHTDHASHMSHYSHYSSK